MVHAQRRLWEASGQQIGQVARRPGAHALSPKGKTSHLRCWKLMPRLVGRFADSQRELAAGLSARPAPEINA
jgi:hypothetical protein